ncbi:imidazole glycerol phosphate synthase subunit HisH [Flavobacterium sp. Fl-77]|uniref:Imidazole glycerol phosphate synthase subunit HisH n=1 Tax=Flavobacterium flavipigmentatum TaxID=2893884 RepID=A0AAJ2VX61_9FLAO|nr:MULTISPECIES: imidazole glycerol phosphate synthase subunit HisH [unclassified Flavobacterium]MDX6182209.1 imidazole glycerol phosphate synthase subunit HisH [Flavobacterium sp. Fl-33]MDX6185878.1 imidazole glycerol phosphate synthase subunit HisH [Flavobacterium sp. Fl-77]UFH39056.1 imidazole glycerol phosphate synthase subunit HisH [Flavobacterium sp. F-70]
MITIIDYGVGNINAFVNVYKRVNVSTKIAKTTADLEDAQKIILPGVGHFDHAMSELIKSGMREKLDELVMEKKIPVIGICVGMQMMGHSSDEGKLAGLGWIDASIKKFDETKIKQVTRLPHMGWNDVNPVILNPLFQGLEKDALFYFLHSYYFECNNPDDILATSDYGGQFACAAHHENIYGIQFHPEKSHHYGETLLHNFAKL